MLTITSEVARPFSFGLLTGILAVLGSVSAAGQTSITACGFVISTPGNYAVNADLNCAGDAIVIKASQVSLKLNGHKLTGPGGNSDGPTFYGIKVDPYPSVGRLNHIGIEGPGLIQHFWIGIGITNADYCQVDLVTIAQNYLNGLEADVVNYANLVSNVIVGNPNYGLSLSYATNSVVAYNEISGNYIGANISGLSLASANTVNNNTVSGNRDGLQLGANNSRVYANVTNGNGGAGITVASSGNQIFNNKSVGNLGGDLEDLKRRVWHELLE